MTGPDRQRSALVWRGLLLAAILYFAIATIVFSWRHTWMTDRECLLHFVDALLWRTVPR